MRLIDADALMNRIVFHTDLSQDMKELVEDEIENAPTIPQWIPCSERLPEEREWIGTKQFGTTISDEVYVTIEVPSGERITKHMCFQNGSIPAYKQRSIDAFYKGGKVVAWMPIPDKYE